MSKRQRLAASGALCVVAVVIACVVVWRETGDSGSGPAARPPSATGGATPGGEQVAGTLVKTIY